MIGPELEARDAACQIDLYYIDIGALGDNE